MMMSTTIKACTCRFEQRARGLDKFVSELLGVGVVDPNERFTAQLP
jgi:hypothetical protein